MKRQKQKSTGNESVAKVFHKFWKIRKIIKKQQHKLTAGNSINVF